MSRAAAKSLISAVTKCGRLSKTYQHVATCEPLLAQSFCKPTAQVLHCDLRFFSSHKISKNLQLMTQDDNKIKVDQQSFTIKSDSNRPLVVMLSWIAAKKKHVEKFSDLYLYSGYDVLIVPSTALQCVFPVQGSQVVAEELLKFLAANPSYKQVIVHGFSVGGYLWGEVCLKIHKYSSVPGQLTGEVWDSLVDVMGVGEGIAAAIFPKQEFLRKIVKSSIQIYMWLFRGVATKHYIASSACFHNPPVKAPTLMFLSRADAICSFKESLEVAEIWRQQVKVTLKIWDDSPHVGHYRLHSEEYIHELNDFLQSIKMPTIRKV